MLVRRLRNAFAHTSSAATSGSRFNSRFVISTNLKNKLFVLSSSNLTYSFICPCSARYAGNTARQLPQRIKEYRPAWLKTRLRKFVTRTIGAHLAETGHQMNDEAFKVIYKVPGNLPKFIRQFHLTAGESVTIRLLNPSLCSQKNLLSNHSS